MSATASEKMPSASVTAKPKMRLPNCFGASVGLRSAPCRKLPKMMPTPTPAPPIPMQAMPAPINFAASASMFLSLPAEEIGPSVARVKSVVQVDAGQHREHVGLEERHQEFERIDRHRHAERDN